MQKYVKLSNETYLSPMQIKTAKFFHFPGLDNRVIFTFLQNLFIKTMTTD